MKYFLDKRASIVSSYIEAVEQNCVEGVRIT